MVVGVAVLDGKNSFRGTVINWTFLCHESGGTRIWILVLLLMFFEKTTAVEDDSTLIFLIKKHTCSPNTCRYVE